MIGAPPWKLNLGCGLDHREGYVNIDREPFAKPDVLWDIELAWDCPSDSVDHIIARHVVEHIHDLKNFFQEAHRVMLPDAKMEIRVPHHCSDFYWGDPTHVRPITVHLMNLLSKTACDGFIRDGKANTPLAHYWQVDFETESTEYGLTDHWKDKFQSQDEAMHAIETFNNVVGEVKFILRCVKDVIHESANIQSPQGIQEAACSG